MTWYGNVGAAGFAPGGRERRYAEATTSPAMTWGGWGSRDARLSRTKSAAFATDSSAPARLVLCSYLGDTHLARETSTHYRKGRPR
ncbi:hypothetical protein GCM10010353_08950 [Streptomyces chryseus]|nr:hypothetical protein GCM10010353_08950 [Streptomyces chryseus]